MLALVCEQRQTHDMDMPSTNITSHFYTYVRDTCRFSSDSDTPAVSHLRNPRSGGPADLPLSLSPCEGGPMDFLSLSVLVWHICTRRTNVGHISPHYSHRLTRTR